MFGSRLTLPGAALASLLVVVATLVVARASSGAASGARYVVEPGDTLWSIAERRYEGDPRKEVFEIVRRNGLTGGSIVPGQVLELP